MEGFVEIDPLEFTPAPMRLIGKEWMLISATRPDGATNTMTAAWGGFGWLWEKPVAFVFIRPERYTHGFVESSKHLSLSFLGAGYRDELRYLGTVSGRDEDKVSKSGLTLAELDGVPFFEESSLMMLCTKLYEQRMEQRCFLDESILQRHYSNQGFHDVFVVEVERILQKADVRPS